MRATAKDLRFHAKELFEAVSRGEEIIITYRGKDIAKLVPFEAETDRIQDETHDLFGIWRDEPKSTDVEDYVRSLRKARY
ncbi:type II toxin-antitoxin system prevent-host-death family antitoxin [candidate division KSB1 bacterium]|nr:type II toxin-antitoxin system prevent-host-death family antitoxin [candidate division KSB1 bacterium]